MAKQQNETKKQQTTDAELITALINCGGVRGAANALQLSTNAIYKRLQNQDFRQQLEIATNGVIATAAAELCLTVSDTIGVLQDIAKDGTANAQTRMLAADKLLGRCIEFLEISHKSRRRDEAESQELKLDFGSIFGGNYDD